jgi:hypothetical protein
VGLYGVIESLWFGRRAHLVAATVVNEDRTDEVAVSILEFTAAGSAYRVRARGPFGVAWGPSPGVGAQVAVLYPPDHPEAARLADRVPRFAAPLILLALGLLFTPAGVLVMRHGLQPAPETGGDT